MHKDFHNKHQPGTVFPHTFAIFMWCTLCTPSQSCLKYIDKPDVPQLAICKAHHSTVQHNPLSLVYTLLIPSATEIGNKSSLPAASQGKFRFRFFFLAILAFHLAPLTWPTGGPTKYVANYSKNRRFYVHFRLGLHSDTVCWLALRFSLPVG